MKDMEVRSRSAAWTVTADMWAPHNLKMNLIKNPCALEDFKHWTIDENGGDRWKVEDLPGEHGEPFPNPAVTKYFVTSHESCKKSQLIDLNNEGFSAAVMDKFQPAIVITDWYGARKDCGCRYELAIRLLCEKKRVLQEFIPPPVDIPKGSDCQWRYVMHSFSKYGPGVRYISFQHGGKDTQNWAGWYGPRVTNSSVSIEL
ncbi:PREDICTED: F-box only protein 6-like [Nanorana parkeri]|uniref:F-box only protein 6-like n=1 Tax=Nanorana parkeri TaxID=125878 RepID=UPI0008543005|nr:PREDICTED: F-box only protein 6-like [Nanorana parkeri]